MRRRTRARRGPYFECRLSEPFSPPLAAPPKGWVKPNKPRAEISADRLETTKRSMPTVDWGVYTDAKPAHFWATTWPVFFPPPLTAETDRHKGIDWGMTKLLTLTKDERAAWRGAMQPVWDKFADEIGKDLIAAAVASNR